MNLTALVVEEAMSVMLCDASLICVACSLIDSVSSLAISHALSASFSFADFQKHLCLTKIHTQFYKLIQLYPINEQKQLISAFDERHGERQGKIDHQIHFHSSPSHQQERTWLLS